MSVKVIGKHEKDSRACRDALALTLNEMMAEDKSIVYVDCDLMGCINTKMLRKNYPDRAFEAGIAEANGAGVAAGLAAAGKKVPSSLRSLRDVTAHAPSPQDRSSLSRPPCAIRPRFPFLG